eukprot:4843248-Prymnesium_polylepis.1
MHVQERPDRVAPDDVRSACEQRIVPVGRGRLEAFSVARAIAVVALIARAVGRWPRVIEPRDVGAEMEQALVAEPVAQRAIAPSDGVAPVGPLENVSAQSGHRATSMDGDAFHAEVVADLVDQVELAREAVRARGRWRHPACSVCRSGVCRWWQVVDTGSCKREIRITRGDAPSAPRHLRVRSVCAVEWHQTNGASVGEREEGGGVAICAAVGRGLEGRAGIAVEGAGDEDVRHERCIRRREHRAVVDVDAEQLLWCSRRAGTKFVLHRDVQVERRIGVSAKEILAAYGEIQRTGRAHHSRVAR